MAEDTTDARKGEAAREVLVALGLSLGACLALGLSRFAYALLLPAMRADLGLSYFEAGSLNTANAAGYIPGALAAAWCARRWGGARAFLASYAVSVAVLLLSALATRFSFLLALRTIGGVSTSIVFVLGAGLASAISPAQSPRRRGLLVGLYVGGVGVGLLAAGAVVPLVLRGGEAMWPEGWLALGLVGAAGFPGAFLAARKTARPAGGEAATLAAAQLRQMAPMFVGYCLFGAGYIGYMTFVVALLRDHGGAAAQLVWFWLVLGAACALSGLFWGRFLGGFDDGRGVAVVYAAAALGALPVLVSSSAPALFASAVLFGGSFSAGPMSAAIVAQRQLPPAYWTAAISLLTVSFGFGQTLGPVVAGAISDAAGGLAAGFLVSPVLLAAAAAITLLQRPPPPDFSA